MRMVGMGLESPRRPEHNREDRLIQLEAVMGFVGSLLDDRSFNPDEMNNSGTTADNDLETD